jgi:dTMP kinase
VREATRRGKKKEMFTPTTFSLIHATDFADRLESYILPLVRAGAVVCADRYAYTAFARDVARGVSRRWVRNLYRFALRPDLRFYFRVPLDIAIQRILGGRNAIKYYEAGMDLGLSRSTEESFRIFQGRILDEYEAMAEEVGFRVIDATQSIEEQQQQMRAIVMEVLGAHLKTGVLRAPMGESHGIERAASVL